MLNFRESVLCLVAVLAMAADTSSSDAAQQLSAGNAKFSAAFFDQIRHQPGNLFYSPISIETVLALAHAGAAGKTATQIQEALLLPAEREKSAERYGELVKELQSDTNITLNMVNGLYADKQFQIKPDYLDVVRKGFQAQVDQVEFGKSEEAANVINGFVSKNTNNKITKLFDASAFSNATKLVLLNAIYFKADWAEKFPESSTHKGIFHLDGKTQKEVDFMQIKKKFAVLNNEQLDAQIVEIPYKGDSVRMVLVVPNTVEGLPNLEAKLASINLNELRAQRQREVLLTMPKFKLEETIKLDELLIKLGMSDLFSESDADLSRISNLPLVASQAIQKAFIEVNEAGSEAAAATGIKIQMRTMPMQPLRINVDSPFLVFIKHNDVTLFAGRVTNPIQN